MLEGRSILVVEDEIIIAFALEDMLVDLGAEVIVATSLDDARAQLGDTAISVAILDVNVHGTKSYPVAEELADRGVPLIFATGYGDAEHPPRFCASPTLTKPYTKEQLVAALQAVDFSDR